MFHLKNGKIEKTISSGKMKQKNKSQKMKQKMKRSQLSRASSAATTTLPPPFPACHAGQPCPRRLCWSEAQIPPESVEERYDNNQISSCKLSFSRLLPSFFHYHCHYHYS